MAGDSDRAYHHRQPPRQLLDLQLHHKHGQSEAHPLTFYDRNPSGRELDFIENPDKKRRLSPLRGRAAMPKPSSKHKENAPLPLQDLVDGAAVLLEASLRHGTELKRDMDQALGEDGTHHAGLVPGQALMREGLAPQRTSRSRRCNENQTHTRPRGSQDNFIILQDIGGSRYRHFQTKHGDRLLRGHTHTPADLEWIKMLQREVSKTKACKAGA